MSDKDYQSGLAWRFYLPHPQIPSGLTCTCRHLLRSPIIDQEGHHLTTGCLLRGILNYSMLAVVPLLKTAASFERMIRKTPDIILVFFSMIFPSFNFSLVLMIHLMMYLVKQPYIPPFSTIPLNTLWQVNTTQKNNKYLRVCADNGVPFLPFSSGIPSWPHQASFYRSIPSTNLYTFFTSILSVGLQTALSDAILIHSTSLRPSPSMLVTVSDSTTHIYIRVS